MSSVTVMGDVTHIGAPPVASPLVLTQSEMATWMDDRRAWYLAYYRRMAPRYDHEYIPSVGTFFHLGLEAYYREQADPLGVVQDRAEKIIAGDPPEQVIENLLKAAELAAIMLEGYLDWCPEEDAHLEVFAAEETVEILLAPYPYLLRGKIDARATDLRTDLVVQLEHKTCGSLTDIPKTAQENFQFLTYDLLAHLAAQAGEGKRTDGVLLNMARRVKRTKTAVPPFYARHVVRHNLHELRNHWKHVTALGDEISAARAALDNGADQHRVCPPHVNRDSSWKNKFLPLYRVMDDGGDWEGMLNDLYVESDPLARYDVTDE